MMRLLAVELNRFRSRRAIALLVLAGVLLAVVLAAVTAWQTRPLTAEDRTTAAAQAELEGQRSELQSEVRACRAAPEDFLGPDATADDCDSALVPGPDAYYPRDPLDLRTALGHGGLGLPLAVVVISLMVIAGSTFVGADWSSGSLTNQLLFVPRRVRLWLAKAGAVTLSSGVVALVALSVFWLILGLVASARGISVPASDVTEVGWHVVRATVLAMGAGLGAFALTTIFRHTVATLALLFVYSIGGEIVVNLFPIEGAARWSIGNNALGWLADSYRYVDASITCTPGERCSSAQVMTHLEAGSFLAALLAVVAILSILWFSRRDV